MPTDGSDGHGQRWPTMGKLQVICKFMVENLGFESAESAKILRDEYFQSGAQPVAEGLSAAGGRKM